MSFLGSPPLKLRTRIGVYGDCGLLGSDPTGERGRPYDTTQAMLTIEKYQAFSPNCVRWIAQPVYKEQPDGSLFVFHGLDALGQWWYGQPLITKGVLLKTSEPGSDNRSWFDKAVADVGSLVINVGIPIAAAALAATGVGVIGSVALLAWRNLALGQSLTQAILSAQRTNLATSDPSALDAFNQGLAKAEGGLTDAALHAVSKELAGAGAGSTGQAFYQAVALVRVKQVQDLTIGSLATVLSADEMNRLRLALKWGSPLSSIMNGLRGKAGDRLLSSVSQNASVFVAANTSIPGKVESALASPATLASLAPASSGGGGGSKIVPPGGSGSGGGFISGLGTVAVVGVLGYGAYKFGPSLFQKIFHRGGKR